MSLASQISALATRVATEIKNHLNDTSGAHAASAISYSGSTNISATNVEAALDELDTEKASTTSLTAHTSDTTAAHAASAISFTTPTVNDLFESDNVQDALTEAEEYLLLLQSASYQPLDSDLTAIAALSTTAYGRSLLEAADAAAARTLTGAAALGFLDSNIQTGTTYTLAVSDVGKVVQGNHGTGITITVPTFASVGIPVGSWIEIYGRGAGSVTISAPTVVLNSITNTGDMTSFVLPHRYSLVRLWQRATDVWVVSGNVLPNIVALPTGGGTPSGTPSGTIIVRY